MVLPALAQHPVDAGVRGDPDILVDQPGDDLARRKTCEFRRGAGRHDPVALLVRKLVGGRQARLIPTIAASGAVTLGGTLDVTGLPVGTHTIVTAGSVTGTFGSVLADPGRTATVDYSAPGSVSVTVG